MSIDSMLLIILFVYLVREMDARDMKPLPDKSFDLVIDKGKESWLGWAQRADR